MTSSFLNDVAKGIMIGAILGQGSLTSESPSFRITTTIFWILVAFGFLTGSLYLGKEIKNGQ